MPYYITKNHPDCKGGWATVNGDYELKGCHKTKDSAIKQMVAISQAEEMEPGGTHPRDKRSESARLKEFSDDLYAQIEGDEKAVVDALLGVVQEFGKFGSDGSTVFPNYVTAADNVDKGIGVKCSNCVFHQMTQDGIDCSAVEGDIEADGICRFSMIPPGLVNARESLREAGATYKIPAGVQSAAKRALKWISEGKAGDGFTSVGRRRASQLAAGGTVSREVIGRMRSFFSRHEKASKGAEGFSAGEKGYPSPGRVAWDAWGGDAGYTWVKGIKLD
jgi:hypothetical protein